MIFDNHSIGWLMVFVSDVWAKAQESAPWLCDQKALQAEGTAGGNTQRQEADSKRRSTKDVHAISEGDKGQQAGHACGEVSTGVGYICTRRLLRAFGDFSAEEGHDSTFISQDPPGCYVQNRLCGREMRKEVGRRWWWLEPGCHALGPNWVLDKFWSEGYQKLLMDWEWGMVKKGVKDDFQIFALRSWKNGGINH